MGSLLQPSPILRLPFELLQTIFLFGYKSQWAWNKNSFAAVVSLVCRTWTAAAIQSPRLWSMVVFNRPPPFERQRLQIERSRGARLTIEIQYNYGIKQTVQLIKLLRPHVARWKSLTIDSDEFKAKSYRLFFDELRYVSAPMLKTLDVVHYNDQNHGWTFQPFGGGAPRLSKLGVSACRLKGDSALFGHLTELDIRHPDSEETTQCFLSTNDILGILTRAAASIIWASIDVPGCSITQNSSAASPSVILPRLKSITLSRTTSPPSWIRYIYSGIAAPEVLSHSFDLPTLHHLATHNTFPFPNLTQLQIGYRFYYGDEVPQATFVHALSGLPQLQELTVEHVNYFDPRILASLCDQLTSLTIRGAWTRTVIVEHRGMEDMIETRRRRSVARGLTDTLQHLILEMFEVPEEEKTWLRANMQTFQYTVGR